jgi:hypothetical protein
MALFPAIDPSLKTADGIEAVNPDGLIPRTIAALKKRFPELGVMTDVALDPYTTHGQDGVIDADGHILSGRSGGRRGRHRRAFGHDGRPHRAHTGGAGCEARHPYAHHGLLGQVRVGLLRSLP